MLSIDGSTGLGSGQLVRTAITFSALTKTPVTITNIRSKRPQPGLKQQHFSALQLIQQMTSAQVKGLAPGSTTLEFIPQKLQGINTTIDIKTAGSITLLIQNIIIPLMFADTSSEITIIGGTDVPFSPSFDYLNCVFLPHIKKYAKNIKIECVQRGFYPKGNGKVTLEVTPKYKLNDFKNFQQFHKHLFSLKEPLHFIEQGNILSIEGSSITSTSLQKAHVAERQKESAEQQLPKYPTTIYDQYEETLSPGSVIALWAKTTNCILGADALGERGKPAEDIGKVCARKLLAEIDAKACVDQHLADHLVPLLALFSGSIKTSLITDHLKTNIWICEQFFGKCFEIDEKEKIVSYRHSSQ